MSWTERVDELPATPGVYLFKSSSGRVLYVGKAQSLRARVRSYLGAGGDGRHQVPHLLERVAEVDVLVTPSVKDALLLENELIKQHRPPFNVRLRDDKQYLGLRLDGRESWPRLQPVRRFREDGAQYFGPYTSSQALREAVSNLRRIFPLRSCSDPTFKDYARRGRPCIEFEMRRCLAPCCGRIDEAAYAELVKGTALFLRGRSEELVRRLRERMEEAARQERFEEAARVRDQIGAVEQTVERQGIVGARGVNRDVFGLARSGGEMQVQVLYVRDGRVIGASDHGFSDVRLDDGDAMSSFLGQYYGGAEERPVPSEVLTPVPVDDDGALELLLTERAGRKVRVHAPRRGALREIVAMASANAQLALGRRVEARESVEAAAEELRERLALGSLPRRIECYDVSTLQGVLSVASRVVFEDGRPVKAAYRRYRIREAAGGDDYACLREVLRRRLARADQDPLPDLLVVDGGKGQLGVVTAALRDAGLEVPAIGLAKERDEGSPSPRVRRSGGLKAERVFVPRRKDPVLLSPSSRGLLLLQRVRDESHRFAIEFQRALRNRASLTSVLQEIPGIGPAKRRALLKHLGSLRAVRTASIEALTAVPGLSARDAQTVRRFFDAAGPPTGEAEATPPGGAS
ncbi:MAG TPA: excinuclease ABC subunit UvrC [Myxococcota bacterium]|nr:excinuclease ABC subunit UvrC [Myxococcota bacterium]